jgi:hypothetical protein
MAKIVMAEKQFFSEENIQRIFGHEAAEDESPERLREYYFKSTAYESMRADLSLRILVGHKGIGKSALFSVAKSEDADAGLLSLSLVPDDISEVDTSGADFNRHIQQWKTGLLRIIRGKIFQNLGVDSSTAPGVVNTTGKVISWLKETAQPYLANKADLSPTEKVFADKFLNAHTLTLYIDDLDRGWQGRATDVHRISALLNALRDLSNTNRGLRFRVALRSDVYFLVRTSDESTDKIEGSVIWYAWNNHEILAILVKRILTFFGEPAETDDLLRIRQAHLADAVRRVMVPVFRGQGKWSNIPIHRMLMTMVRKRPRDIVKLCTLAARRAREARHDLIATEDFRSVFEEYSQGRVQDTINEHRTELPEIERLIMNMKPSKRKSVAADSYLFTTDQLLTKLQSVSSQGKFYFSNKREANPKDLAAFLYKINFLTARKDNGGFITRRYFEESRYLSSTVADFGFDWEIHPAYRWALQPSSIDKLYEEISPESDV